VHGAGQGLQRCAQGRAAYSAAQEGVGVQVAVMKGQGLLQQYPIEQLEDTAQQVLASTHHHKRPACSSRSKMPSLPPFPINLHAHTVC
jgi:hypothetical protein